MKNIRRVILSKKGADTSYGKVASIIENDVFYNIPIPMSNKKENTTKYSDIVLSDGTNLLDKIKTYYKNFEDDFCHLDPNLSKYLGATHGIMGQTDNAQNFLKTNKIKKGDVFLFFARYAEGRHGDIVGNVRHVIWGYLIIDDIIEPQQNFTETDRAKKEKQYPWIKDHPHWKFEDYKNKHNNCIYIGKDFGVFNYRPELNLTLPYAKPRYWSLPEKLNGLKIKSETSSKTSKGKTITDGNFTLSTTYGQEFIIEESKKAEEWALALIKEDKKIKKLQK